MLISIGWKLKGGMAAGRITELLIVSEEQEKIAFKENRTHYFFVGWMGALWKENGNQPWKSWGWKPHVDKAEFPRATCSRPCPVGLWVSPNVEPTQPLWATCSTVWLPSPWKMLPKIQRELNCCCPSVCFLFFLSCLGTPNQESVSHQRSLV